MPPSPTSSPPPLTTTLIPASSSLSPSSTTSLSPPPPPPPLSSSSSPPPPSSLVVVSSSSSSPSPSPLPNPSPLKRRKLADGESCGVTFERHTQGGGGGGGLNKSGHSSTHSASSTPTRGDSTCSSSTLSVSLLLPPLPPSAAAPLFSLSDDVLVSICEHFTGRELGRLERVCVAFRRMLFVSPPSASASSSSPLHPALHLWRGAALHAQAWPFPNYIDREHMERVVLNHIKCLPTRFIPKPRVPLPAPSLLPLSPPGCFSLSAQPPRLDQHDGPSSVVLQTNNPLMGQVGSITPDTFDGLVGGPISLGPQAPTFPPLDSAVAPSHLSAVSSSSLSSSAASSSSSSSASSSSSSSSAPASSSSASISSPLALLLSHALVPTEFELSAHSDQTQEPFTLSQANGNNNNNNSSNAQHMPPLDWRRIVSCIDARRSSRGSGTLVLDMGSCTVSVGLGGIEGVDNNTHNNTQRQNIPTTAATTAAAAAETLEDVSSFPSSSFSPPGDPTQDTLPLPLSFPAIALNELVGDQISSASVQSINPVSSISMPILHANETGEFSYCSPIWKYALQRVPEEMYAGRATNHTANNTNTITISAPTAAAAATASPSTPSTSTSAAAFASSSSSSSSSPSRSTSTSSSSPISSLRPAPSSLHAALASAGIDNQQASFLPDSAASSASSSSTTDSTAPSSSSSAAPSSFPSSSLPLDDHEGGIVLICDQLLGSRLELAKKRAKVARILFALQNQHSIAAAANNATPTPRNFRLAFCNESFLSLLNTGRTTGIVLHVGFSRSTCAIFVNGRLQNLSSLPTRMVGGHIHSRIMLQALFSRRQFQPAVADMFTVIPLLKAQCYVADDTAIEQTKPRSVTHVEISVSLNSMVLGHERFTSSDVFFLYGFPAMVVEALQSSPAWPVLQRPVRSETKKKQQKSERKQHISTIEEEEMTLEMNSNNHAMNNTTSVAAVSSRRYSSTTAAAEINATMSDSVATAFAVAASVPMLPLINETVPALAASLSPDDGELNVALSVPAATITSTPASSSSYSVNNLQAAYAHLRSMEDNTTSSAAASASPSPSNVAAAAASSSSSSTTNTTMAAAVITVATRPTPASASTPIAVGAASVPPSPHSTSAAASTNNSHAIAADHEMTAVTGETQTIPTHHTSSPRLNTTNPSPISPTIGKDSPKSDGQRHVSHTDRFYSDYQDDEDECDDDDLMHPKSPHRSLHSEEEDASHQLIKTLLQNIVLSGRSTNIKGFGARFERDLNAILKQNTPAKVHDNHVECSWLGGRVLSSLSVFPQLSMTREEFKQDGINAILRHMEI